jgi:hypothetical protein
MADIENEHRRDVDERDERDELDTKALERRDSEHLDDAPVEHDEVGHLLSTVA